MIGAVSPVPPGVRGSDSTICVQIILSQILHICGKRRDQEEGGSLRRGGEACRNGVVIGCVGASAKPQRRQIVHVHERRGRRKSLLLAMGVHYLVRQSMIINRTALVKGAAWAVCAISTDTEAIDALAATGASVPTVWRFMARTEGAKIVGIALASARLMRLSL
eukprot:scaffold83726_cov29-Tisochrysis_lutea.AAC.4